MEPKYPGIKVDWSNIDGNAFVLLGSVRRAMRDGGIDADVINEFSERARSGDYDHLIQCCMAEVNIVFAPKEDEEDE